MMKNLNETKKTYCAAEIIRVTLDEKDVLLVSEPKLTDYELPTISID